MRPEDAVAIHESFAKLHREGLAYASEYAAFASRWGEIDAVAALRYLGGDHPASIPAHDLQSILRGWATTDPKAAMAWLGEHSELANAANCWTATISGWMTVDPEGATSELSQIELPPSQMARCFNEAARIHLFDKGIESTAEWLADLARDKQLGPYAATAWNSIVPALEELPYDRAANVWTRFDAGAIANFDQFLAFSRTVGGGRSKTQGSEGFYQALQTSWPPEAARASFDRWGSSDGASVVAWLATAPPGPLTDWALQGLANAGLAVENPGN